MASIRKRGETYQITVSLGVKEDGTQNRKMTTFAPTHGLTEKQGLKAAREYAREFENKCRGLTSYDENMTLQALCEWYYTNIAPQRLRQRTLENFRYRLDLYVLPKLGQKKLRDLKPAMLAAHFAELQKSGGAQVMYRVRGDYDLKAAIASHGSTYRELQRQGVCCKSTTSHIANGGAAMQATCQSICNYLGVPLETAFEVVSENNPLTANTVKGTQANLSAVFTAAVKAEIMTANPLGNVDLPQVGEIDRPVLTPEQAKLFLSRLSDVQHISVKAILIVELLTGARTGELRALLWHDINLDNGTMNICKSVDAKNRVTPPKTKSSIRIIKMDAVLIKFFYQYRQLQDAQISAAGSRWTDNNIVFPNTTGGYLNACLANRTLKEIIQGTDIPQTLHAHSLRHSFASILIDSGANVKTVQDALGHSSSQMTLDIYSHSFASARAKAMEAVSLAITGGEKIKILNTPPII
jgi:integrase